VLDACLFNSIKPFNLCAYSINKVELEGPDQGCYLMLANPEFSLFFSFNFAFIRFDILFFYFSTIVTYVSLM